MKVAKIVNNTEVEGPGNRTAIWLQGCSIKCSDCCNPELIDCEGGKDTDPVWLASELACNKSDGITILGGEPLDQSTELLKFLYEYKKLSERSVMLFTGYNWQQITNDHTKKILIENCDLVVAGPFLRSLKSNERRWIGSDNQTIHFITKKLLYLKGSWPKDECEIEISIIDDEIVVNGAAIDFFNHKELLELKGGFDENS